MKSIKIGNFTAFIPITGVVNLPQKKFILCTKPQKKVVKPSYK